MLTKLSGDRTIVHWIAKNTQDNWNELSTKETEKEKEKVSVKQEKLSEEDLKFNQEIAENAIIYGTFYSRFGEKDTNFRIVDKRKLTDEELRDKRKQLTGMSCDSYSKKELIELVNYINSKPIKLKDKKEMCQFIYNYLKDNKCIHRLFS